MTANTEQVSGVQWGYGRVSTLDQNPDSQHDALLAAGVAPGRMMIEKASTRLAVRPKLEELRKLLSRGDTITVTKADRIARSTLDLLQIVESFDRAGVKLEILTGAFNRDDAWGKALFGIQAVFAELERDLIQMRTNEGLASARARGRTGGRKAKLTAAQAAEVRRLYAAREKTVAEIGALFGITRESVYRYVKAAQDDQQPAAKPRKARTVRESTPPGKTLGEMTPEERAGTIRRTTRRFEDELQASSEGIAAVLDSAGDTPGGVLASPDALAALHDKLSGQTS